MRSGRLVICLLLALSFMLAPLLCLRFCEAVHAARMQDMAANMAEMHMHAGHGDMHAGASDEHRPPLNELSQMLAAMMNVLPAIATLFIFMVRDRSLTVHSATRFDALLKILLPPPRLSV